MNKNTSTTLVEQRKDIMRRSRKKRIKNTERARNKSEALKKDIDAMEAEDLSYDDEATKELDMLLILSEAVI